MGRPNSLAFVASVVAAAIVFLCSSAPADAKLKTTYYERTCPRLQEIVRSPTPPPPPARSASSSTTASSAGIAI
ncbi:hypothetical protein ACMD2_00070 [Ananas comosus]|uniref:Uncharacterized protein n=1 Tax=Ananas comosus TaxID=4615 RepID=A0A199VQ22_ANACO|nr:hypothetical protein ACMD2_00070 [Ananas comosus]